MRRVHLRGRENILKRLMVHSGAANLSLVMRKLFGNGTPRAAQGRSSAIFQAIDAICGLSFILKTLLGSLSQSRGLCCSDPPIQAAA